MTKQKEILRRLKIIKGHLAKVIEMVEKNNYCVDILQQSLAVQNALKKVDILILDRHFRKCVANAFEKEKDKKEKVIKELLKIYQFSKK